MLSNISALCSPPEPNPGFSSLGDVTRAGVRLCEAPRNLDAVGKVQQYRTFRMRCLGTTLGMIDSIGPPSRSLVSVRLKRLDSICRKIGRVGTNFTLGQMDDVIGVRIVCPSFQATRAMSARVRSESEFYKSEKDYTTTPKETGYRAAHHIMHFGQALAEGKSLNVRFEIQVRSFLQHRWAIWSESHGEETKAGNASEREKAVLRAVSAKIAKWEESNPDKVQGKLASYTDAKNVIVAWRQKSAMPMCIPFRDNADAAVRYLNHLETHYPAERGNALLLVGVSDSAEALNVLRQTHPLYTMSRVISPDFWLPSDA